MRDTTFVILSFEGPDRYSRAGGLGSRVTELSQALAALGFETHLFFIGDPDLPGYELLPGGRLFLHRWCQWISRHHPCGVYDGEEGKLNDWNRSLPGWLERELIGPKVARGESVVVMAEEWQTVNSVIALSETVAKHGWERSVHLLWNANNTFSFNRIDWSRLKEAATVTTVSRFMKHVMWDLGVDAWVVPNGISSRWLEPVRPSQALARMFKERTSVVKVARFDPDKRWHMAVGAVSEMKRRGMAPLFLARGGLEAHGEEVMSAALDEGLNVREVQWTGSGPEPFLEAIRPALEADMVVLRSFLSEQQRRILFHAADAVLANSGVEPFGLVGLETMAVGGLAFVGCTGEDYVTPGLNAVSLQTAEPREIVRHLNYLRAFREVERGLRREARRAAAHYTWEAVIRRALAPALEQQGVDLRFPSAQDNGGNRNGTTRPATVIVPAALPMVVGQMDQGLRFNQPRQSRV